MTTQFIESQLLESHTCWKCAVLFAAPSKLFDKRRSDGQSFFCPNGHGAAFKETTETRLKRDLDRERQVREAAEARAGKAEQNLSQVTRAHRKMRERVMNGVCPCC